MAEKEETTDRLSACNDSLRMSLLHICILMETGFHCKGCGCKVLALSFEGLKKSAFMSIRRSIIEEARKVFDFDLAFLHFFPGTERITRVSFRRLCEGCERERRAGERFGLFTEEVEL